MRDQGGIVIDYGDEIDLVKNEEGEDCIRIQNAVWVEEPRFIEIAVGGKHDREYAINKLIWALTDLRDRGRPGV